VILKDQEREEARTATRESNAAGIWVMEKRCRRRKKKKSGRGVRVRIENKAQKWKLW